MWLSEHADALPLQPMTPADYMKQCLHLARKGAGYVAPNPLVGSVIVRNGQVIGEGWHRNYGGAHAEVNAIQQVADERQLTEATLYVNLEPCSHFGKTPPCADLIVEKKIPHVVIGMTDPNPLVAGKGIDRLIKNGVTVTAGILEQECEFVNRRFITWITKHRPYVILKWAESADGYIDHVREDHDGQRALISGAAAQELVHQWRSEESAIMVGTNTVLADNPQLTTRLVTGPNPVRVTFDRQGRIPTTSKILDGTAPTIVFHSTHDLLTPAAEYVLIDFEHQPLAQALRELYSRNLQSVLVEGGAALLQKFMEYGVWDEARVIVSNKNLEGGVRAPQLPVAPSRKELIGDDEVSYYYPQS